MKSALIIVTSFFFAPTLWASACCGGTAAAPSIISGDNKAQVSMSYSRSEIAADVNAEGYWRKRDSRETSEQYRIEAAHLITDRTQMGLTIPVIQRERNGDSESGLGDTSLQYGYEYLTDWDYHPYRPKGIGYIQLVLPTGKSIYESNNQYGLDARGRGFWALGLGTLLTKAIGKWDVSFSLDVHRVFSKTVATEQFEGTVTPGWGWQVGPALGYNWKLWRLGGALSWTHEDGLNFSSGGHTPAQRMTTGSLNLSYLFAEVWSASLSYADQTLFGSPSNTTLARSMSLQLSKRWDR